MNIEYSQCPLCGERDISKVLRVEDKTVTHEYFIIWKCASCTLRFTQGIPDAQNIDRYYKSEDYVSHSETTKGLINTLYHSVRKITLRGKLRLVKRYTKKSKGNILDIGAGTGAFLEVMAHAGWQYTGIEPDENARANALKLHLVELKNEKELFILPSGSFDAVTMWHVLEHVHRLHDYVSRIKELLKPGGKAFIAVPNYTSYDARRYQHHWAAYDVPRHLYHFSPQAIKTLMEKHGMHVEKMLPMWFDSFYVSLLSEQYENGKTNFINGMLNGALFNLKTLFNKSRCSSLIYVISKD